MTGGWPAHIGISRAVVDGSPRLSRAGRQYPVGIVQDKGGAGDLVAMKPVDGHGVSAGGKLQKAVHGTHGNAASIKGGEGGREIIGEKGAFDHLVHGQLENGVDAGGVDGADAVPAGILKGRIGRGQQGIVAGDQDGVIEVGPVEDLAHIGERAVLLYDLRK